MDTMETIALTLWCFIILFTSISGNVTHNNIKITHPIIKVLAVVITLYLISWLFFLLGKLFLFISTFMLSPFHNF